MLFVMDKLVTSSLSTSMHQQNSSKPLLCSIFGYTCVGRMRLLSENAFFYMSHTDNKPKPCTFMFDFFFFSRKNKNFNFKLNVAGLGELYLGWALQEKNVV